MLFHFVLKVEELSLVLLDSDTFSPYILLQTFFRSQPGQMTRLGIKPTTYRP